MYIEAVPNRTSPPAIRLRESCRDGDKVRKRTLLNLTDGPADLVAGFGALLKGGTVIPSGQDALTITRALPHGHGAARPWRRTAMAPPPLVPCARSVSTACSVLTATAAAISSRP